MADSIHRVPANATVTQLNALESLLEDSSGSPLVLLGSREPRLPQSVAQLLVDSAADRPKAHHSAQKHIHAIGSSSEWDDLKRQIADARICAVAPNAPIVAVMGLLNAGKSSLVASFLSEAGRKRILIGSGNRQGTHRFVLWLPSIWRESEQVWNYVQTRLSTMFPHGFELLSDDPEIAAGQYNDTSSRNANSDTLIGRQSQSSGELNAKVDMFEVPLVAFDTGLDQLKIALMDSPDVQTGWIDDNIATTRDPLAEHANSLAAKRLAILAKAAPLCGAFLVVLPANALHDETVSRLMETIRKQMPHSTQIVVVNRVPRRYTTESIYQEVQTLYANKLVDRTYMAYGFDGPQNRERIPEPPTFFTKPPAEYALPLFFRIDPYSKRSSPTQSEEKVQSNVSSSPQPPGHIEAEDWLLALGDTLDTGRMLEEALNSHLATIASKVQAILSGLQNSATVRDEVRRDMLQSLSQACMEFSKEPGGGGRIRLQASRKIVEQISESLERTAPWWAMPGRWTSRMATFGKDQVGQWVRFPSWLTGKAEELRGYIRSKWGASEGACVVTADALIRSVERQDYAGHWAPNVGRQKDSSTADRTTTLELFQKGIDRFQAESRTELDAAGLDEVTRKMWTQMPIGKRIATGLAPAAVLFAPLVAVIMLPLDFGGSSVLVFASVKELLGAGVAGLGMAMLSQDRMPLLAEGEAAWQQLADLVAVLCDELGLERPSPESPVKLFVGGEERPLAVSSIPPLGTNSDARVTSPVPVPWQVQISTVRRIEAILQTLLNR